MNTNILAISILAISITACGGGDSSTSATEKVTTPTSTPVIYTGVFIDSAVEGLNYQTESQSGKTNTEGEFNYQLDEMITFSIGGIKFPAVAVDAIITPLDIFKTESFENIGVINMARLLQSLDIDGIASNGIELNENIHTLAAQLNIDFTSDDFDDDVTQFVLENNAVNISLISPQQAINHLKDTLLVTTPSNCSDDHPMVGFTGSFSTLAHNVSGDAEILDSCTIIIRNFNYDSSAPAVYFYSYNTQFPETPGFTIGDELRENREIYSNETITVKLPNNKTLDDIETFSVWCVDFLVSFGDLTFTAP